ncbi:MAG: hypothetical protein P8103_04035 [Candidatus Thiodiazotropha sp.]|jgi:hypothetical protein
MVEESNFIETAREAIDQLKRLTHDFPRLSTRHVKVAIETWNEEMFQKGEIVWLEKQRKKMERDALAARAVELIETHHTDDVLDMLIAEFDQEIDFYGLLDLCGREKYIDALRREANELKANSISPEQTADLWNMANKPAIGGERWNAKAVSVLMG